MPFDDRGASKTHEIQCQVYLEACVESLSSLSLYSAKIAPLLRLKSTTLEVCEGQSSCSWDKEKD